MLIRILIIIVIFIFYDKIFDFFKKNSLNNIENIGKKLSKNSSKIKSSIFNNKLKTNLNIIKSKDKNIYKKCKNCIKVINILKDRIENNMHLNIENDYKNLNFEKSKLLNIISSMIISLNIFPEHPHIVKFFDEYTTNIINQLNKLLKDKDINVFWFEADPNIVQGKDYFIEENYSVF